MARFAALAAAALLSSCSHLGPAPVPAMDQRAPHAVVFDIDGTLTPRVWAIFQPRVDAAKVVRAYSDKGYTIIYLSSRRPWLSAYLPDWLRRHGFPTGAVHVSQGIEDHRHPDVYKSALLQAYRDAGYTVDYAFGDSSTDLAAYASVGIEQTHVFAMRRRGESVCQPGPAERCLAGWSEHLAYVATSVPIAPVK